MKKQALVLTFALLLAVAWAGLASAAEFTLGGGVAYQLGNYALTWNDEELTAYESSASAPPLRYELDLAYGAWNLTGFLATMDLGKGKLDADLYVPNPDDNEVAYGGVTAFGGDIAYLFDVGSFKLGPSIGYRNTRTIVGIKSSDDDWVLANGRGLRTRGLRLGAETSTTLGDRFSFAASIGYSPRIASVEIRESVLDEAEPPAHNRYDRALDIDKPDKASSFDMAIAASVRVIPAIEIVGGYRYETTSIELDPDASGSDASAYAVKASVFHIGARCIF